MIKNALFILIGICILSASCRSTFLQRKYMSGLYADNIRSAETRQHRSKFLPVSGSRGHGEDPHDNHFQNANSEKKTLKLGRDSILIKRNNCGDTILLQNNQKIPCRVSLITDTEIQYMHCCHARLFEKVKLCEVKHIRYYNGVCERFRMKGNLKPNDTNIPGKVKIPDRKSPGFAVFGLVSGMLAGFLLVFGAPAAGLIIAGFSLAGLILLTSKKEKVNPSAYRFFRVTGSVLGATVLALVAIGLLGLILLI